jgi:UDP-glucose 4-epimerase
LFSPRGVVLITGGAGFVGNVLCRQFLADGIRVRILDSFAGGPRTRSCAAALHALGAEVVEGDIRDRRRVDESLSSVSGLVHLAAISSVPACTADPESCHQVNVEGTRVILDAALRAESGPVVLASSAAVYGPHPPVPTREDAPLQPASPYAESKVAAEGLCAALIDHGLPVTILRPFNIYGPGQDPASSYSGVISRWIAALLKRRPLTLYGDGRQTRDFIHVEDVGRAIRLALEATSPAPGPVNVASGLSTSLLALLDLLGTAAGVTPDIQRLPEREGDVWHSRADTTRSSTWLGFNPTIRLGEGLHELIAIARSSL